VGDLGCAVRRLEGNEVERDTALRRALEQQAFDYVMLFESSGMYNGEDAANLASHLTSGRLDAIWGSRRLSVRDIQASYRLRYRHRALLGAVSYAGSHVLSLLYLTLYGRYVSDTLSAARAVRVGESASPVAIAAQEGRDVRGAGAVLRDLSGSGAPHERMGWPPRYRCGTRGTRAADGWERRC
jgi:hypothetical protein